jgi:hypothetical protein
MTDRDPAVAAAGRVTVKAPPEASQRIVLAKSARTTVYAVVLVRTKLSDNVRTTIHPLLFALRRFKTELVVSPHH